MTNLFQSSGGASSLLHKSVICCCQPSKVLCTPRSELWLKFSVAEGLAEAKEQALLAWFLGRWTFNTSRLFFSSSFGPIIMADDCYRILLISSSCLRHALLSLEHGPAAKSNESLAWVMQHDTRCASSQVVSTAQVVDQFDHVGFVNLDGFSRTAHLRTHKQTGKMGHPESPLKGFDWTPQTGREALS